MLLSRVAERLYWAARYLERAEATLRLIRALASSPRDAVKGSSTALHTVERIQRLLLAWGATSQTARTQPARVVAEALQNEARGGWLHQSGDAQHAAVAVAGEKFQELLRHHLVRINVHAIQWRNQPRVFNKWLHLIPCAPGT